MRVPSWPSTSSARIALDVAAAVVLQAHDEVEAALADPDLGALLADEADAHGADHVARA